ncbi:MAG TPA: glycosyltransferase family 4 protein [Gemmatimonadaceae bacterium]|nr:glycosyltransferase family 4 protein [Gemmatimonadaceae bacterium]
MSVTAQPEARRPRSLISTARVPRVLFVEPNDDGTVGGSHQVLLDFARNIDRRRYEPVAVFYQDNVFVARLRDAGVEVHLLADAWHREKTVMRSGRRLLQGRMFVEAVARRVRFLRQHDISILHINGTPQTGHDDWLPAAFLLGMPAVANCAGNVQFDVRSFMQRAFMRSFDHVLAVSSHVGKQVVDFGYEPTRVTTIHPGIDLDGFRSRVGKSADQVRAELSVPADTMLVTMVGNIRPWKGQHVAIDAMSRLPDATRRKILLLIVGPAAAGDSSYEAELRERVKRDRLEPQVRFLGLRTDVPDLMAASDVVLHASTEAEPFGLVVVEGMALGRPVIASSIGGPTEILDRRSGLMFSPDRPQDLARHLSVLASQPERRRELGEAGRARAQKFSIASTVRETMRLYDQLLGKRPVGRTAGRSAET